MCLASSLLVHFRPSNVQESVAPVPEGCAVLYGILTNVCAGSVSLSSSLSHCGPLLSQLIAHTAIDGEECVILISPQCSYHIQSIPLFGALYDCLCIDNARSTRPIDCLRKPGVVFFVTNAP